MFAQAFSCTTRDIHYTYLSMRHYPPVGNGSKASQLNQRHADISYVWHVFITRKVINHEEYCSKTLCNVEQCFLFLQILIECCREDVYL